MALDLEARGIIDPCHVSKYKSNFKIAGNNWLTWEYVFEHAKWPVFRLPNSILPKDTYKVEWGRVPYIDATEIKKGDIIILDDYPTHQRIMPVGDMIVDEIKYLQNRFDLQFRNIFNIERFPLQELDLGLKGVVVPAPSIESLVASEARETVTAR